MNTAHSGERPVTVTGPRAKIMPAGEALRRALRWMSEEGRHDAAAVEEACRRFDLSPAEEEFLLAESRRALRQAAK